MQWSHDQVPLCDMLGVRTGYFLKPLTPQILSMQSEAMDSSKPPHGKGKFISNKTTTWQLTEMVAVPLWFESKVAVYCSTVKKSLLKTEHETFWHQKFANKHLYKPNASCRQGWCTDEI